MGFTLNVRAGRIAAMLDCPAGWQVKITNDPSWNARIQAIAIVGAAAIDASQVAELVTLAPEPPGVEASLGGRLRVTGTLTIMRDGNVAPFPWRHLHVLPKIR